MKLHKVNQFQFNKLTTAIRSMLLDVVTQAEEISCMNKSSLTGKGRKLEKWIGWQPPAWPWCKLNSDAAVKSNGISTPGGLIQDSSGKWVGGFAMNIGHCTITVPELWGLYQGLVLAWHYGVHWLLVEVDSLCVVQSLKSFVEMANEFSPLVRSIKELMQRSWHITINHIYREANFAADYLANYASDLPRGLHNFSSPLSSVIPILRHYSSFSFFLALF